MLDIAIERTILCVEAVQVTARLVSVAGPGRSLVEPNSLAAGLLLGGSDD